ncbi:MAG TPA: lysophospholipid acyltransferase family protein [Bacteroidales bacterium]|nr:lysophospholipid acyltransferase family protein [Bacteroidales bacterium]
MRTDFKTFLISLYIWTFILATLTPLFALYVIIWLVVYPFDRKHAVTQFYTMLWTRLYLTCNPGWHLKVEGRKNIGHGRNYIFVANHQSVIDIALLNQLNVNFRWVSKIELSRVPFVGWVIRMNGHILVKRGDKLSVVMMAESCIDVLKKGISVFMFPEGTRSSDGNIQPFKEGAFILAKSVDVPIIPVVIDGAGEALPRHGFWFQPRQTFTVRILEEIPVETVQCLELNELINLTSDRMIRELKKIRMKE